MRTHILQSLALMQDIYCREKDRISLTTKEIKNGITLVPKKYLYMFLKIKDAVKESQHSTKIKYILLIHYPAELIFGIQQSHVDQKKLATM